MSGMELCMRTVQDAIIFGMTKQTDCNHCLNSTTSTDDSFEDPSPELLLFHNHSMPDDPLLTLDGSLLPASFRVQSLQITTDIIQYVCAGSSEAHPPLCKSATIMRSLVDDLLQTRLSSMRQLADKLDVHVPEDVALLNNVATAMFDDDIVTWGRVITLFAFAGYLARHCQERGLVECSVAVNQVLDTIVVERLGLWILACGGWDAFERQFPAFCVFDFGSLWKIAAVIGLVCGAAFAFYSSVKFMSPTSLQ